MIWAYLIAAIAAFSLRSIIFNIIGFEYKMHEEGFVFKKFLIDFITFFVMYTFSLYIVIIIFDRF